MNYFNFSDDIKLIKDHYDKYGYIIIENCISDKMINNLMKTIYKKKNFPKRKQDLWKANEFIRLIAKDKKILSLLKKIYNKDPLPFQTLNFAEGTQQEDHVDLVHFAPSEDDLSLMCGVWYALEDIKENMGPLIFYPESHKLPPIIDFTQFNNDYSKYASFLENYIKDKKLKFKLATIKKGSAIIWASNLIHGGSRFKEEGTTRYSMVTHYFFKGSKYWWTPRFSNKEKKVYRDKIIKKAQRILW